MHTNMRSLWIALALSFVWIGDASGQRVRMSVDGDIYAGLPFVLSVSAEGFDESPEPSPPKLSIEGAKVEFVGVSPSVFSSVMNINGRRSVQKEVKFIYRYRITVPAAGRYELPAVQVVQGQKSAESPAAEFEAADIDTTPNMAIELGLPERPVWIGETFDLHIDWLLRSDPNDPSFIIPLFDREDLVRVAAPENVKGRTIGFQVGDRELELPYTQEKVIKDGETYTRFRFTARVTPQRAGSIEVPATAVVARLRTGYGRDAFGFRTARTGLFKAEDRPRTFEVKPVPAQGKPVSFAGAIGSGYSITSQASRTVVRVGDPIDLEIVIRGSGELGGLRLPALVGKHALPDESFEVPSELPPGELIEDGAAKRFVIPIRLRSTEAREIPQIAFSYFDPKNARYETVRTQPIALSIAGSNVVGAGDVVAAVRSGNKDSTASAADVAVVDAELALSAPEHTLRTVLHTGTIMPYLAALYIVPLLLLGFAVWTSRTREMRGHSSDVRAASKRLRRAIEAARSAPARDHAPAVLAALRKLAALAGTKASSEIAERLETEGYRREAKSEPLAGDLLDDVAKEAARMTKAAKRRSPAASATAVLALLMCAPHSAQAQSGGLEAARALYAEALSTSEPETRAAAFATAADAFAELIRSYPNRPELLTDWGNAALGARDFGTATLAYRRALRLDPDLERARRSLAWLALHGPSKSAARSGDSATDTLFFWHGRLSTPQKHLVAAVAFAIFVLLVAPLAPAPSVRKRLRWAALVPCLGVVAMLSSIVMEDDERDDVVVIDGTVLLRSADSMGAPAASAVPPGAGAQADAIDERDGWLKLRFPDGSGGWMPKAAVAYVMGTGSPPPNT